MYILNIRDIFAIKFNLPNLKTAILYFSKYKMFKKYILQ